MDKSIESVKVTGVNEMTTKDGTKLIQCTAFTTHGTACVFYRPEEEKPQVDSIYDFYLQYSSQLKPYIKIVKREQNVHSD